MYFSHSLKKLGATMSRDRKPVTNEDISLQRLAANGWKAPVIGSFFLLFLQLCSEKKHTDLKCMVISLLLAKPNKY